MRNGILSLLLLLFLTASFSQRKKAYTQLMIPKDLNSFPLLISNSFDGNYCEYNPIAEKFITDQEHERSIKHQLVSPNSIMHLDSNEYPYVIYPHKLDVRFRKANGFGYGDDEVFYSKHMSYRIYDRRTDKYFRPYAEFKNRNKDPWDNLDYSYPAKDLSLASPRLYFKELTRLIKALDKYGHEEAFKRELKRQNRIIKPLHLIVIAGILVPVGIGIFFLLK